MKKNRSKKQKGSALLLTLGILSLALIMGMSFAYSARTNRQVAKVNADLIKSRLLAESCLNRVLASMKLKFADGDDFEIDSNTIFYPAEESSSTDVLGLNNKTIEHDGFVQHYATLGSDKSAEDFNSFKSVIESQSSLYKYINDKCCDSSKDFDLDNAGFMTILDGDGKDVSGNKVVGRIGFLVLEESSKLDINQLLTLRQGNDNIPFVREGEKRLNGVLNDKFSPADGDYYYPIHEDGFYADREIDEENTIRLGLLPQEIRVDKSYLSALSDGYASTSGTSTTETKVQWFSYDHLKNVMNGDGSKPKFEDDYMKYTFFSAPEEEAYLYKDGSDYSIFGRFDLTGYEWGEGHDSNAFYSSDKPQCENKACGWYTTDAADADDLISDLTSTNAEKFDGDVQFCIPFLDKMKTKQFSIGSVNVSADNEDVAKDIAANMIDFCDKDNKATIDQDAMDKYDTSDPVEPEYCGNELVPYVNEVKLDFDILRTHTGAADYRFDLKYMPTVEFVNIFNEDVSADDIVVNMVGTFEIVCGTTRQNGPVSTTTEILNDRISVNMTGGVSISKNDEFDSVTGSSLTWFSSVIHGTTAVDAATGNTYYSLPDATINFSIDKIVVATKSTTGLHDLAYINVNKTKSVTVNGFTNVVDPTTINNYDNTVYVDAECYDPRVNHKSADWDVYIVDQAADSDRETIGDINTCYTNLDTLADDGTIDLEDYSSMKFSTAYIKNAPFDSLWELGSVSRGEPFRTINLTKYTSSDSTDGYYTDGDAAILDQVKIGPARYAQGKFNPNSRNAKLYREVIMKGIDLDDTYDDPSYDGNKTCGTLEDGDWEKPTYERGALANVMAKLSYDNDREAEAYIGRTANILSTRSDAYTIIIVAQSMQELDSSVADAWESDTSRWESDNFMKSIVNPTKYNLNSGNRYCSILGTQIMLVNVVRDAWTNEFKIVGKRFFSID